jgi:biotin carboxylase
MSSRCARVAVLAAPEGSLSLTELMVSADGIADVCIILDRSEAADPMLRAVAEHLAPTYLADFSDTAACLRLARDLGVAAVVTFADPLCHLASLMDAAARKEKAEPLWGRKDKQRKVLFDAGISRVRSAPADDGETLWAFTQEVGYPVVVKPAGGVASRDTWILRDEADAREFIAGELSGGELSGMYVEEFIESPPARTPQLADYVSAEIFRNEAARPGAAGGGYAAAFVTDRLPLAWPCRETGLLLPSALPADLAGMVIDTADRALRTLCAGRGVFHVEIKPAPPAPEIIEVNGRLGGFIARLARYGAGADLGRLALSCYVGGAEASALEWTQAVAVLLFQPPSTARRIEAAPSRREAAKLPGVLAVDEISAPGCRVDWRLGTNKAAARIWLAAPDRELLLRHLADTATWLSAKFKFTDSEGQEVSDMRWIDRIAESAMR